MAELIDASNKSKSTSNVIGKRAALVMSKEFKEQVIVTDEQMQFALGTIDELGKKQYSTNATEEDEYEQSSDEEDKGHKEA
eukprot:CAMPEP_0170540130 /NCGR_PEP_ID=MMETSP0211-20121228/165_1 /TAXON_ID=311385 /ORGANISM="Pseudokeronopsis sp., Strain OXSARD2" /LENGTH=80 /DNA_ID=CAMNT_0010842419 /DNA_START=75 /DNA_END=317 /DNA_ORIENTATION=-